MCVKQISKLLITILIVLFTVKIEFVKANCTTWNFFLQTVIVHCNEYEKECCGFLHSTCCTTIEKNENEALRNIICRIIVFIIVIGIILIFFAFLIGWIYSCYLIAKQIQETPDDNETEINGQSLVVSFFTRYINTLSLNHHHNFNQSSNEVFSIPISDKPPSYNTLFKSSSNQHNQSSTNRSSNASENPAFIIDSFDELPDYPGVQDGLNKFK